MGPHQTNEDDDRLLDAFPSSFQSLWRVIFSFGWIVGLIGPRSSPPCAFLPSFHEPDPPLSPSLSCFLSHKASAIDAVEGPRSQERIQETKRYKKIKSCRQWKDVQYDIAEGCVPRDAEKT